MDSPGYILLSRLSLQERSTQALAHNIANADTPGFRAMRPIFGQVMVSLRGAGSMPGDSSMSFPQDRATWRDMSQGSLQNTGNPLDVAIDGDGFFVVETPQGERYTRAGRFSIGANGRLVDQEGNAVLDSRGRPISFSAQDTQIEITKSGTIQSENGEIAKLRVVRFERPQNLMAEGNRLFDAKNEVPLPVEESRMLQGMLEGSNISPVLEITRLTAEMREFQYASMFTEREGERITNAVERILRRRS
ncbi:MAG: flagellar basal-body rod protein FlgF [Roseomonas sp.]|nr:flagellar basal-body rod protein FlgF [Roseomonas sp.]MCA3386652.1 flagellar basal-body rod protein FlgF [Roseomonas sp.]MCA3395599.1 flagellar basal-body rod protein FlgF [Roseomonas sp.]MCA3399792.1 flagellar basal-body rod protein FlgF [Roseomonas sp.]